MQNTPAADNATIAVFLDLENIVIGARDARYADFDIRMLLERLLLKGHIVVKKAYCDFERYKDFKRGLHEAAFELIDIPHVRQSGKNSADIRLVVDALDLCYMKSHVDTFAIVSGDSDFSPLVSKLRENAKTVIGVGVKNSTSDLFIKNCDEFIYYDDLVRAEPARNQSRVRNAGTGAAVPAPKPAVPVKAAPPARGRGRGVSARQAPAAVSAPAPVEPPAKPAALPVEKALEELMETLETLRHAGADDAMIYASVIKAALKRRNPGFNERAYGFRSFNDLLQEAHKRGLLVFTVDPLKNTNTVRLPE